MAKKGETVSAETRAKMSAAVKATWTEERREKQRQANYGNKGKKRTPEQVERHRQWMLANAPNRGKTGALSPHFGKKRSAEFSTRMAAIRAGKAPQLGIRYGISPEQYAAEIAAGKRWCSGDKHFAESGDFGGGNKWMCTPCFKKYQRIRRLKKFGVTSEWYDAKLAEQNGGCAICDGGTIRKKRYLCVDHNHKTKAVRGLLCSRCNAALERLDSVADWATKAVAYLQQYS